MSYPKEITLEARNILARRRESAASEANARRVELARIAPRALALEREISTTSARLARAVLDGGDVQQQVEKIRVFYLEHRAELDRLLVEAGYPTNALEPQYHCTICGDTGVAGTKLCSCVPALEKALMYDRLGASAPISEYGFDRFHLSYYSDIPMAGSGVSERDIMQKTLATCQRFSKDFSLQAPSLLLMGPPGLGKTHLSLSIACAVIERGFDVMYLPFHTLLVQLETAKFGHTEEEFLTYLNPLLDCELLILDDLGSEMTTSFTTATLYNIINSRFLKGAPTIISTNLTEGELSQRYHERIRSRLLGCYQPLPFVGKDVRLQKLYQR